MEPIIDAHGHLGDILYRGGADLIAKTGVTKRRLFDPATIGERQQFKDPLGLGRVAYRLLQPWVTRAERARNFTATLENFSRSLDESGITHGVCLPVPPHVSFTGLAPATAQEPRIVPFTAADYTIDADPQAALAAHVAAGARGLKLHPIIQKVALTDERTMAAVEAFAVHDLPVLFHCGVSSYYLGRERSRQQPSFGKIHYAAKLVRSFPRVRFIAGHAGLFEVGDVIEQLGGCDNVWVDTSFQSVATVDRLIATFGADHVLFGSDWPYGNRPPMLSIARAACRGDHALERRLLFDNAAELLGIA